MRRKRHHRQDPDPGASEVQVDEFRDVAKLHHDTIPRLQPEPEQVEGEAVDALPERSVGYALVARNDRLPRSVRFSPVIQMLPQSPVAPVSTSPVLLRQ